MLCFSYPNTIQQGMAQAEFLGMSSCPNPKSQEIIGFLRGPLLSFEDRADGMMIKPTSGPSEVRDVAEKMGCPRLDPWWLDGLDGTHGNSDPLTTWHDGWILDRTPSTSFAETAAGVAYVEVWANTQGTFGIDNLTRCRTLIFGDGFEGTDTSAWSNTVQ